MVTTAVSPLYIYSKASTAAGSTTPVPVAVATTRTSRRNPPVRRSSRTASSARSRGVPSDSTPTYTRTGCSAGSPENRVSSATVGPRPTKSRP